MRQLGIFALHVAAGSFVGWVISQLPLRPWSTLFWIACAIGVTFSFMAVDHLIDGDDK